MLVGGASVEYFANLADNPKNLLVFGCFQGAGSLGRQVQEGNKEIFLGKDYSGESSIKVNFEVQTINGLSAHSGRNELMQYISRMVPKPKKVIISHGEIGRCLDLASSIYRMHKIETVVPRNLETVRLR